MSMMETYKNITKRGDNGESVIHDLDFLIMEDCQNDYYKEQLPIIPAGTQFIADFAGDFGCYGMVEVGGKIHKVKLILSELDHVNWGKFDSRTEVN